MSDLISRSEVLELLYKIFDKYQISTDKNPSRGESFGTDVFKEIKEMPTAYSVDKVMNELNKLDVQAIKRYKGGTFGDYEGTDYYIKQSEAIEIVKQGGVSDDTDAMCEWKVFDNSLTNEPQWVYETTCGKYVEEEHTSKAFVYCPYCSKKIKAVE